MISINKIIAGITIFCTAAMAGNEITSGFEYLRTDFCPRTAATSNAFLSATGDISTLFVNPAGMAFLEQPQYTFNYTNYILDINGGMAGYAQKYGKLGIVSIGLVYMNYGTFDYTDENANSTGETFSANDLALGIGIANHLDEQFTYGVNLKYAFSKIENYNASAIALDFGLMYAAPFQENLNFAVSVQNLGSNFEYYDSHKETLPMSIRIGFSKKLAHLPLEFAASLNDLNVRADNILDRIKRFSVGGEFTLSEMLRLRLGYNNNLHSGFNDISSSKFGGVSGGLGIYWKSFRFDYAYSNFSALGTIHRFGITGSLDQF
jgi:hypothetical protein